MREESYHERKKDQKKREEITKKLEWGIGETRYGSSS